METKSSNRHLLNRAMNYGTTLRKITQPHLFVNNMFPLINSRPTSEDLGGINTSGTKEVHAASKQNLARRQAQTTDQHRRSPLKSNTFGTPTFTRYASAAASGAATSTVQSTSTSISPLARSPSFVQTGSTKLIYRSSDYGWNDHPNTSTQALRACSPTRNRSSVSARHLTNGTLHESTAATTGNSLLHIPPSSASPQQHSRLDMNNGDLLLTPAAKPRHSTRLQRANSHLDRTPTTTAYGLPMRSESYRSSRLDYSIRPRHSSSRQRNYVTSKTSFHDITGGEFYLSGTQDENIYYHQQQQQMNLLSSSQRLNGSTFDLTANRKAVSPAKTSSFNVPASITGQHAHYTSTRELQRSETNIDRNHLSRFTARGTTAKEQVVSTPKYRQTARVQNSSTVAGTSNGPGERHPSAQSYKSRDPNISYAYTNVKKYIEDNDLMSPGKEQIIRNWILDVEKYRHHLQKIE